MWAAPPEQLVLARVALQARKVFLSYRVLGIFGEAYRNGILGTACLDVYTARTVTRLATPRLIGSMRMLHCFSHGSSVEASALVLVTGDTGVATDIIAVSLFVRRLCL